MGENAFNLTPWMIFRLMHLSYINHLRKALLNFYAVMWIMKDILFVCMMLFYFYAILGLHLFRGKLKYKCFDPNLGVPYQDITYCLNYACPDDSVCFKGMINDPSNSMTNFDTFLQSMIMISRIITF